MGETGSAERFGTEGLALLYLPHEDLYIGSRDRAIMFHAWHTSEGLRCANVGIERDRTDRQWCEAGSERKVCRLGD